MLRGIETFYVLLGFRANVRLFITAIKKQATKSCLFHFHPGGLNEHTARSFNTLRIHPTVIV